jgi:hypothetical protein
MYGRKTRKIPLGGWLILSALFLLISIFQVVSDSNLLAQGVTTQAVVLSESKVFCGHPSSSQLETGGFESYSVQFSDQSGHTHTGIISPCQYGSFTATTGESVTIVYDPSDPSSFAPSDALKARSPLWPIITLLVGLITLVLLFFWIRKRIWQRHAS